MYMFLESVCVCLSVPYTLRDIERISQYKRTVPNNARVVCAGIIVC